MNDIWNGPIGLFRCRKHNVSHWIYERCWMCECEEIERELKKLKKEKPELFKHPKLKIKG